MQITVDKKPVKLGCTMTDTLVMLLRWQGCGATNSALMLNNLKRASLFVGVALLTSQWGE
jgi:hypothetical protein